MRDLICRVLADETGATVIEYALIASLIAVLVIGAVATLGQSVRTTLFDQIAAAMP